VSRLVCRGEGEGQAAVRQVSISGYQLEGFNMPVDGLQLLVKWLYVCYMVTECSFVPICFR
jgi:hypothetical protein